MEQQTYSRLRTLLNRRHKIAELQRRSGVALADWLRFNAAGSSDVKESAKILKYIEINMQRIESCTQDLLPIEAEIESLTQGMSEEFKESLATAGLIL